MARYLSLAAVLVVSVSCTPPSSPDPSQASQATFSWTSPVWWKSAGTDQALGVSPYDVDSIVVVGRTDGGLGQADAFVSRVTQKGDVLWTRFLGSAGVDLFLDVGVHPSGQIFAAGVTTGDFEGETLTLFSDGALSAFGPDGEILWSRILGVGAINQLSVISDGILVTGSAMQSGHHDADAFVAKVSLAGETLWTRWLGDMGMDAATGVVSTDEQITIVGFREVVTTDEQSEGTLNGWVSTLQPDGGIVQTRDWDLGANESFTRVCVRDEGNLLAAGYTDVNGNIDAVVVSFDTAFREINRWVSHWEGDDAAYALVCAESGHVYLSGRLDVGARSDAFWTELDNELNLVQEMVEAHPGRDEWVDLVLWHDALCAVGYRANAASVAGEDLDAVLDCMPQGGAP